MLKSRRKREFSPVLNLLEGRKLLSTVTPSTVEVAGQVGHAPIQVGTLIQGGHIGTNAVVLRFRGLNPQPLPP